MGLRNRSLFLDKNCFFVTTTCRNWLPLLRPDLNKKIVCDSISFVNNKFKCCILGYVIMPNHIHLILFFKENNQLSAWMRDMKKFTSTEIRRAIDRSGNSALLEKLRFAENDRVFKIWEDRFDDLYLENKRLLEQKLKYIHLNPLQARWRLVMLPHEYTYSSAMFYETGTQSGIEVVNYLKYF
jgi:putative transposase